MESKLAAAFSKSLINAIRTITGEAPVPGEPTYNPIHFAEDDAVGTIGITGEDFVDSVSLFFARETLQKIHEAIYKNIGNFKSVKMEDTIGELINLTIGGARSNLEKEGITFESTIPKTTMGRVGGVPDNISTLITPFKYSGLPFYLEVYYRKEVT